MGAPSKGEARTSASSTTGSTWRMCSPHFERCIVLCRPQGTLRCSIRAVWLQHVQPELDGMTDLSCMSVGKSVASSDLVMAEQVSRVVQGGSPASQAGRQPLPAAGLCHCARSLAGSRQGRSSGHCRTAPRIVTVSQAVQAALSVCSRQSTPCGSQLVPVKGWASWTQQQTAVMTC